MTNGEVKSIADFDILVLGDMEDVSSHQTREVAVAPPTPRSKIPGGEKMFFA